MWLGPNPTEVFPTVFLPSYVVFVTRALSSDQSDRIESACANDKLAKIKQAQAHQIICPSLAGLTVIPVPQSLGSIEVQI
jgi:hypothetical protein